MAILRGNTNAIYRPRAGRDVYGQDSYGPDVHMKIGVVEMRRVERQSDLRADSSASVGRLRETHIVGKLLLPPSVSPRDNDLIITMGMTAKIISVFERRDLIGNLSHWEVEVAQGLT